MRPLVILLFFALKSITAEAAVLDVYSFGATGDGVVKDTEAIQAAIDSCNAAGGGKLTVGKGTFLSGQLTMESNVTLSLDATTTIKVNADTLDFRRVSSHAFFLNADGAENFGIVGRGVILGNGQDILNGSIKHPNFRIALIRFQNCRNLLFRDFNIRYSETWTFMLYKCERVVIDGISILNNMYRINTDDIDPCSCKDVFISNCSFVCGDDAICLKTFHPDEVCENIVVTNCTIETLTSGIKFGTSSVGDFRDIHFSNISIKNTGCCIGFFVKDGATIERVTFSNISLETSTDLEGTGVKQHTIIPVYVDIEQRTPDSPIGTVRNIMFSNIQAYTDRGFLLQGMPESALENITLRDVTIRINKASSYERRVKRSGGVSNTNDVRITKFIRQPSYFAFAHVNGFSVDNVRIIVPPEVHNKYPRTALSVFEATDGIV